MENMNFNINSNKINLNNLEKLGLQQQDDSTNRDEAVSIFGNDSETGITTGYRNTLGDNFYTTEAAIEEMPGELVIDDPVNVEKMPGELVIDDPVNVEEMPEVLVIDVPDNVEEPDETEETETEDESISDVTRERRKKDLSEEELAVYEKFEAMLEGLDENDIKGDEIFDFIEELNDEEIKHLLTAYDYIYSDEGGIADLFTELYSTILSHGGRDSQLETFTQIADFLGEEDKQRILEKFEENCEDLIKNSKYTEKSITEYYEALSRALELLLDNKRDAAELILNGKYLLNYKNGYQFGHFWRVGPSSSLDINMD